MTMILARGSGASDFELSDDSEEDESEEERQVLATVRRMLQARSEFDAIALLDAVPFRFRNGDNHFNDGPFGILHGTLPVDAYERLRRNKDTHETAARVLRRVLAEVTDEPRFIVVDVEHVTATWSPPGYECEATPFNEGGYAFVYRARAVETARTVVLKRPMNDDEATARLRREIQEQKRIRHRNVMPILDHASDHTWFAMPLAEATLAELIHANLNEEQIIVAIEQVAEGLGAAHALGLVHRDVTPRNILRMPSDGDAHWVIGDWGLVRRPPGTTTTVRTHPGQPFGTDGFVAPEVQAAGHSADARSDVFSLGRVLGFALTKAWPLPNLPQPVEGRWRHVVQQSTHLDPARRIGTMTEFLTLLRSRRDQTAAIVSTAESPSELFEALQDGKLGAADALLDIAIASPTDSDLWLDYIGDLPQEAISHLVETRPGDLETTVTQLAHHMLHNWGGRDYDSANGMLRRIQWVAEEAAARGALGLLEDAARTLFATEPHCHRYPQRRRTRAWIEAVEGEIAEVVARALGDSPAACVWYLDENWRPSPKDRRISAALASGRRVPEDA